MGPKFTFAYMIATMYHLVSRSGFK